MLTDYQIADIAREVTKEDEARARHTFDVLGQIYSPMGRYGLCVMLYAVAYVHGANDELVKLETERKRFEAERKRFEAERRKLNDLIQAVGTLPA